MYAKKIVLYILILYVLCFFGKIYMSGTIKKEKADTPILTERQKTILKEEGWPEDYNKLEYSQQKQVDRCEIFFKYLDYKYDEDFKYIGYNPEYSDGFGDYERERLSVYIGEKRDFVVEVEKTKNGFEDNYIVVSIREDYENYIKGFFTENYNINNIKVYSVVIDTTITNLDEDLIFDNNVNSVNNIFIDENAISKSEYENLVEEYHNWLIVHNLHGTNRIYFLKNGVIDEITYDNKDKYRLKEYYAEFFRIKEDFDD